MQHSAEVSLLKSGIKVEDLVLDKGTEVQIKPRNTRTFYLEKSRLTVLIHETGNAVDVICADRPTDTFYPSGEEMRSDWRIRLGDNPNAPSEQEFGRPSSALKIKYVGHPARDIFVPLIDQQESTYNPELSGITTDPSHEYERRILAFSPVLHTSISGLDEAYPARYKTRGFIGRTAIAIELGHWRDRKDGRLNLYMPVMTIADNDGLFRKNTNEVRQSGSMNEILCSIPDLAEISTFFQILPQILLTDESLRAALPTAIAASLRDKLYAVFDHDIPSQQYMLEELKKTYGFDWEKMAKSLPKEIIRAERQRIEGLVRKILVTDKI